MSTTTPAHSSSPWFPFPPPVPPGPGGRPRVRLLCFPCAGQGASAYRPWQRLLAPEIEVVPVQLPGREGRATEPPQGSMEGVLSLLLGQGGQQVGGADGYAVFVPSL
ncbi:thioesterase II family protein, partial [Streptomyces smyrnaeus]|uniref:thioesterase II family protein n=1 Tax=Streptomyces smyrnaeus TaxID=1387713 RepID=UPI0036BDABBD